MKFKYLISQGSMTCGLKTLTRVMKLTIIIMTCLFMQVSAVTKAQITLTERQASLEKVLKLLKTQSGYDFFYNGYDIKKAKPVTINLNNVSLETALNAALLNQSLDFRIEDKTVIIKEKTPSFLERFKDHFFDISVSGVVLDSAGKALPGASVTVKGTLKAVTTGDLGSFFIQHIKENSILVISYVGYKTQEVRPLPNTLMEIRMVAKADNLQEVEINAGYYTVKEAERTGSISRITSKDIEKQPVTNILAAMQGRMAGVNITQQNGLPGGSFKIEIRGQKAMVDDNLSALDQGRVGRNEPLYIVDGMPYSSQKIDNPIISSGAINFGVSPLNGINPLDVESIEILKDADATAIYGSRGANGVILITTRKGKTGKTAFSFNAATGASKVPKMMDLMNTRQYLEMRNEAFENDGYSPASTYPYFQYFHDLSAWDQNRYTDWQKELIGGTAQTNDFRAALTGGDANTLFQLSSTYHKEGSVMPGDFNYNKAVMHFNVSQSSNDQRFNVMLTGQYVADKNNLPSSDLTSYAITLAPNAPAMYQPDGELNWENNTFDNNPAAQLIRKYLYKSNTLIASGTLSYKILAGLEFKTTLGFIDGRTTESKISPHTSLSPGFNYTSSTGSQYYLSNGKSQGWNIEPQLSWKKQFGKGLLSILAGTTFNEQSGSALALYGTGFASNALITNLSAAINKNILDNYNVEYRYNAVFGRINYNLNEKYIINLTGRRDGSSRFGPGKQFGNFGAVGTTWLFNKEAFINQLVPFLSLGKLRASYGVIGNDKIGDYEFLNSYGFVTDLNNYQDMTGLQPSRLYNPDFSWESTRKLNLAIDLGFLNDYISLTVEYYRERSSNQLLGIPLAGTTGFPQIRGNLDATVQNKGLEFLLQTINVQSKNLRWSTAINLSFNQNKLLKFDGLAGSTYANKYVIGKPLNIQKKYHYTGMDPSTGFYQFQDYTGDGIISGASFSGGADDAKILIDLTPKYFGGITNTVSYRSLVLDFSIQFIKQSGAIGYSSFGTPGGNNNVPIEFLDRWRQSGDHKPIQKYSAVNDAAYYSWNDLTYSDAVIGDASFIRLKNVSLAYKLPGLWLKKVNCSINLQAQNLLTFTKYKGFDPEMPGSNNTIPSLRVITAGLQLNF